MYAYSYGNCVELRRLVNIYRPTPCYPYQVLDQPGIGNPGPKYFGYYVPDDFGNLISVPSGWANLPWYRNEEPG